MGEIMKKLIVAIIVAATATSCHAVKTRRKKKELSTKKLSAAEYFDVWRKDPKSRGLYMPRPITEKKAVCPCKKKRG